MGNEFLVYLKLGFSHITDFEGYDHMLFVVGLCAIFRPSEWRRILVLITSFTIGHALTLILAGRYGNFLGATLTEQLVAMTIMLTGTYNLLVATQSNHQRRWPAYLLAGLFGLIHGLAFSNFFIALGSAPEDLWRELLAFNLGVELGQLTIVCWFFLLYLLVLRLAANFMGEAEEEQLTVHKYWSKTISLLVLLAGTWMLLERV